MNRSPQMISALLLAALVSSGTNARAHGWPLEPKDQEHPIGNSFGEFQNFSGIFQHKGIDILATPYLTSSVPAEEDPNASWVVVTVGGSVDVLDTIPGSRFNLTQITGVDRITYRYVHLQYDSYDPNYVINYNNNSNVAEGDRIVRVVRQPCDFHHLHYQLSQGSDYWNPLADTVPHPDPLAPEINAIGLARDNANPNTSPWDVFSAAAPGGCTVITGKVDVVVQLRDRDDAGSTLIGAATLGIYDLRWRYCLNGAANCPSPFNTHKFDSMPVDWGSTGNSSSGVQFSTATPWISDSDYCKATWAYMVPTNWLGATPPSSAGNWDTTAAADGSYTVSVEAIDFAGNATAKNLHACIENSGNCTVDLTVRDGTDDTGAIPYTGSPFWLSPDITANRGTADENRNINVGVANTIEVQVWNTGSCTLAAETTYQVCLGWNPPSGAVPYPLPAGRVVDCHTEVVPAGGWFPGTSRVSTFTWTPAAGTLPLGHNCLVAWSDVANDRVKNTPSVVLDDNRAQRNITFQAAPEPGASAYTAFWVNPMEGVGQRGLIMRFKSSSNRRYLDAARIHIPPGVVIKDVVDAEVVGGYKGEEPRPLCETGCASQCIGWEDPARECTLVLGGISPNSRVRLEGIALQKPARLLLELRTAERVPHGAFVDAEIVEYGVLGDRGRGPIGGLTLRFEGSAQQ